MGPGFHAFAWIRTGFDAPTGAEEDPEAAAASAPLCLVMPQFTYWV